MGIFDRTKPRRRPSNDGSGVSDVDLALDEVRAEVPEIDDTIDEIEHALREPMTKEERGCGCWG